VADTDRAYDAPEGEDLLEILQKNEHPIATACGGVASCGHCRLVVVGGMQLLSPIAASELVHLGNVAKVIGARLACQSRVCSTAGDVVVRVPDVADAEERRRRKAERARLDRRPRDGVVATAASATPPAARPRAGGIEWRPGRIHRPPSPKDGSGSPEV
jgi:2Fe-2S ferredoxin